MRTVLKTLAVLALLGLLGAAAVVGLGLYNVSARAGHWPGVSWVLHTTYRNAVKLRAPAPSEVPDISDPALVALGALHFDAACRFCHAAPGEVRTQTARSMTPEPPHIEDAVEHWEPRHLQWIVYEGVKMSGMPGWPAHRPDEVWAVVAFLSDVEAMSDREYAALTAALPIEDRAVAYCAGCHGADGVGELGPFVPRLDILDRPYLAASLEAYREGVRQSGIMQHAASRLSPAALARAAEHYAVQRAGAAGIAARSPDPDLIATGAALAAATSGDDDVPACRACHGPEPTRAAEATPSLSGQHRAYLERQLRLWRDGRRGGGKRANLMHVVARDLTDADVFALAAYYASLTPSK